MLVQSIFETKYIEIKQEQVKFDFGRYNPWLQSFPSIVYGNKAYASKMVKFAKFVKIPFLSISFEQLFSLGKILLLLLYLLTT